MLEHVALQQERFRLPGLRADGRGIAIGEQGLLRFGTLTQVVGFFRAFSEEQSLDHLLPTLRIVKARSRVQGVELLVVFATQGSHMMDRAAAIARLLRGEAFTGRAPHYVRYRDAGSPFGYDVQRLAAAREGVTLYQQTGELGFLEEGELAFRGLLLSLTLTRRRGEPPGAGSLFLRVPLGLRVPVQRFLWERQIAAGVAELVREAGGRFDRAERFFLFRIEGFPQRLVPLFGGLPGVELYHQRRNNVFVQRGYEHPFALESCRKALEEERLFFFSGARDAVDMVEGEPVFVDIEALKGVDLQDPALRPEREAQLLQRGQIPPQGWSMERVQEILHYPVHMIPRPSAPDGAVALFLHTAQELAWLKRLVYAMPATALESYRMALTDHGCVILNRQGIELIPIGLRLREVFNRVFIPEDKQLSPPLSYEQLQVHLGLKGGRAYLMPHGLQRAFWVEEGALRPLASYLLAEVDVSAASARGASPLDLAEGVEMVNEALGYFALWGHNLRAGALAVEGATQPMRALPPVDVEGE
jgi:hypothetical protein